LPTVVSDPGQPHDKYAEIPTTASLGNRLRGHRRTQVKNMKQKLINVSLVILSLAVFVSTALAELAADRIAAVVNGDVILESDIKKQKQPVMRNLSNLPLGVVPPGKWPTEKEILDELVVMRLLEQEAAKKGVKIDEKNIDASIESIRKRNNLDNDQFIIFLSGNGLTLPEYRKVMRRQFTLTKLIASEVLQKIPMNEEDAIQYFKQNKDKIEETFQKLSGGTAPEPPQQETKQPEIPTHTEIFVGGKVRLRQIALKIPSDGKRKDASKVMEKAKLVYREASTGADFAQLAKKYSDDPSAASGGDLGLMNYKDMVPPLQKLVQRLKEGDVSPPLQTPNGIIIFYLAEAKNRTAKKVPIPEKERKEYEKQLKQAQERRAQQQKQPPQKPQTREQDGEEVVDTKNRPKIPADLLSPQEEKEYLKVRAKVIELFKYEKIQSRMKDWIDELKKNSIIDTKL
jgi:peptidyl-prolyl cis-trans isomerase SurA